MNETLSHKNKAELVLMSSRLRHERSASENHLLDKMGMNHGRLTVVKYVQLDDMGELISGIGTCRDGDHATTWRKGKFTIEPHSSSEKGETRGLYSLPLYEEGYIQIFLHPFLNTGKNVALLLELRDEFVLSAASEFNIYASGYKVLDAAVLHSPEFEIIKSIERNRQAISPLRFREAGARAKSWREVGQVLGITK